LSLVTRQQDLAGAISRRSAWRTSQVLFSASSWMILFAAVGQRQRQHLAAAVVGIPTRAFDAVRRAAAAHEHHQHRDPRHSGEMC